MAVGRGYARGNVCEQVNRAIELPPTYLLYVLTWYLRGGEELWVPLDEQIAREEVELLLRVRVRVGSGSGQA